MWEALADDDVVNGVYAENVWFRFLGIENIQFWMFEILDRRGHLAPHIRLV